MRVCEQIDGLNHYKVVTPTDARRQANDKMETTGISPEAAGEELGIHPVATGSEAAHIFSGLPRQKRKKR